MKYRLLWLPLALAACSQAPQGAGPAPATATSAARAPVTAATTTTTDDNLLIQYIWQLSDATDRAGKRIDVLFARADKPVALMFHADRISVTNSCNAMSGGYSINAGKLEIGAMAHTLMACADPSLSALDSAIGQRLQGNLKMSLQADGTAPRLQLLADNGDTLSFTGRPTAETRYGGPGDTIFLEVAAQTVPCNHPLIPNKQCLSVRERHYDEHGLQTGTPGDWQPLNQDIDGYTHEDGIRNVLRVKRYTIKNAPADAPSTAYVLDTVVESEKVQQ
jgi:heat shock protein HslJ